MERPERERSAVSMALLSPIRRRAWMHRSGSRGRRALTQKACLQTGPCLSSRRPFASLHRGVSAVRVQPALDCRLVLRQRRHTDRLHGYSDRGFRTIPQQPSSIPADPAALSWPGVLIPPTRAPKTTTADGSFAYGQGPVSSRSARRDRRAHLGRPHPLPLPRPESAPAWDKERLRTASAKRPFSPACA